MLDGLEATSHWSLISALEQSRPAVRWLRGRRYVEDGTVTTTAAVTSGVPAALHLVAELAGPTEAQRVAALHPELSWTPTETIRAPDDDFAPHDWPVGLNYVMPWFRPTVGIVLREGIGELDATAAFEVYTQSAAASTVALARHDTVRTQHGLILLATSLADAPDLSRVLVPGGTAPDAIDPQLRAWAGNRGVRVQLLAARSSSDGSGRGGGGFSAALQNLADQSNAATTTATAKMIGYPTVDLDLGNHRWPWRPILLAIAGLALAVLAALAPVVLARCRRRLQGHSLVTTGAVPEAESVNVTV
jgi:putative intracellular protease/amidase